MSATSRTGIIYINLDYKNLGYKIYTIILKNHIQNILDATIGENQLVPTKTEQF